MRRFLAGAGGFLLAAMLLAPLGHAQNAAPPAPDGDPAITLPTVDVTAPANGIGLPPPPFDAAGHPAGQTITSIGEERFKDLPNFSIGDVLRESPGVSFKQGNGPRDVGISIRGSNARNGFGIRNIQVFEDGFPVTQPDGLSRTDLTDPHAYGADRCLSRALLGDVRQLRDRRRDQFPHRAPAREINGVGTRQRCRELRLFQRIRR